AAPSVPQVQDGKLRALAVTMKSRSSALPDVPTMAEAGYPDIEGENWIALLVPAGTPSEIVRVLHSEIVTAIALPDLKAHLATLGFEPVGSTPEELAVRIKAELEKWAKVIRAAHIKFE